MKRYISAMRRHPLLTLGFTLATLMTVMFAVRSVVFMVYWSDPDKKDQDIQGWMTARYVAQSWHLPPKVMYMALGTEKMPGRRQTLSEIAINQGISLAELQARIQIAATEFRAESK